MRILFGIPVAVVLMLVTPSVAFAWGAGGGGASVPAFGDYGRNQAHRAAM